MHGIAIHIKIYKRGYLRRARCDLLIEICKLETEPLSKLVQLGRSFAFLREGAWLGTRLLQGIITLPLISSGIINVAKINSSLILLIYLSLYSSLCLQKLIRHVVFVSCKVEPCSGPEIKYMGVPPETSTIVVMTQSRARAVLIRYSKSLCTDILIRLLARDYDAFTRVYTKGLGGWGWVANG